MKINEKNLCAFATAPPYDLDGYLNKRGEVNKAWQRRYFILKGNLLFYFEKKADKEPLGLIIVEGCTIELSEDGEQYCFQIVFNGNRTYILSADSQEVMENWMKFLTCAGYEYKKLMVAELQRQLDEIEESQKKQETIQQVAPKPPPRRQNPFNRSAPPPPVAATSQNSSSDIATKAEIFTSSASDSSSISVSSSSVHQSGSHHHPHQQFPQQNTQYHLQNSTFYSRRSDTNIAIQNSNNGEEFSFRILHEMLAKQILGDMNNRRKQKADTEKPLIVL